MRIVPGTARSTWTLTAAVWLAACGALWWTLPYRPRAAWPIETRIEVHGFIPGTAVLLTSGSDSSGGFGPPAPMLGPLIARDAATGRSNELLQANERLTLVNPGIDGRDFLVGRVIGNRARLFLYDAAAREFVAELPRSGLNDADPIDNLRHGFPFAAFSPDGLLIVYRDVGVADDRELLRVWDRGLRGEVAALPDAWPPVSWSPDGRLFAFSKYVRRTWELCLWDRGTGQTRVLGSSPAANWRPMRAAFSPDSRTLVAEMWPDGSALKERIEVVGWDVLAAREIWRHPAGRASFFADLSWFATNDGGELGSTAVIHRRDYLTGVELDRVLPSAPVEQLFAPDGRLVLCAGPYKHAVLELISEHILGRPRDMTITRPQI